MTLPRHYNTEFETEVLKTLQTSRLKTKLYANASNTITAEHHLPLQCWKELADYKLIQRFLHHPSFPNTPSATLAYRDIAQAGYVMTRYHHSTGLTMTWIGQLLKCYFLTTFNCHDPDYVQAILNGDSLCALAISEPNVGAHPKHLSCTAVNDGSQYIINGEKAFVSHGPYADHFIVLAITNQNEGRKYYSAFLVPANSPGLQRLPPQPVKGLQPSSHCNIVFTDCRIPADSLIGTPGNAFTEISLPMRTLEDGLMLAPIAGAMQAQLDLIAQTPTLSTPLNNSKLGELLSLTESAKELGILAASKLGHKTHTPDLTPLIIGFRSLAEQVQTALLEWHDACPGLKELAADIQILCSIGRQATAARTVTLAERFLDEQKQID